MANPYFNAAYYLRTNTDVYAAGYTLETAEQHYDQYGANEAYLGDDNIGPQTLRKPTPWFDIQYYLDTYPDLLENGVTPATAFHHFTTYGIDEGRSPNEYANLDSEALSAYAAGNPDLQEAFGIDDPTDLTDEQETALAQHFYQYGYQEDRPDLPTTIDSQLTTDIDTLVGTEFNDTFVANADDGAATLQDEDSVDGRGGYNTLAIGAGAIETNAAPELTNVQKIINSDVNPTAKWLDLSNADSLEELETDYSDVDFSDPATPGEAYAFYQGASADTAFSVSNASAGGVAGIHVNFADESTTLQLVLDGNEEGSYTRVNASDTVVTTYEINTLEGNDGQVLLAASTESVIVEGAGNFDLASRGDFGSLVNFDASEATGNITIGGENLGGAGDLYLGENFVIETGSGDDMINLSTNMATGYVDAGAGDDTIIVNLDAANGSVWTLAGGEGADTFTISGVNWGDGGSDAIITDFNGADGDTLELGFGDDATEFVADNIIRNVVLNSQTVDEAIGKLVDHPDAFTGDANVAVFEFGANTYAVYEAEGDDAGYGAIQLSGVDLGLDADNIDGFTVA